MQMEIKFRALDRNDGKVKAVAQIDFLVELVQFIGESGWVDFNNVELMQYTGLKDKNGKEIYEGDIVSCYYACGLPFNAVVEFRDGCFDIKSEHSRDYLKVLVANRAIEVIGNIHDNPELLEVSE